MYRRKFRCFSTYNLEISLSNVLHLHFSLHCKIDYENTHNSYTIYINNYNTHAILLSFTATCRSYVPIYAWIPCFIVIQCPICAKSIARSSWLAASDMCKLAIATNVKVLKLPPLLLTHTHTRTHQHQHTHRGHFINCCLLTLPRSAANYVNYY